MALPMSPQRLTSLKILRGAICLGLGGPCFGEVQPDAGFNIVTGTPDYGRLYPSQAPLLTDSGNEILSTVVSDGTYKDVMAGDVKASSDRWFKQSSSFEGARD